MSAILVIRNAASLNAHSDLSIPKVFYMGV